MGLHALFAALVMGAAAFAHGAGLLFGQIHSGGGGVTYPLLAPNGSSAAPSYSFSSKTNSGMYSDGTNLFLQSNGHGSIECDSAGHAIMLNGLYLANTNTAFAQASPPNFIHGPYVSVGSIFGFPALASDPTTTGWGSGQAGYFWFNSTSSVLKFWDGAAVRTVTSA